MTQIVQTVGEPRRLTQFLYHRMSSSYSSVRSHISDWLDNHWLNSNLAPVDLSNEGFYVRSLDDTPTHITHNGVQLSIEAAGVAATLYALRKYESDVDVAGALIRLNEFIDEHSEGAAIRCALMPRQTEPNHNRGQPMTAVQASAQPWPAHGFGTGTITGRITDAEYAFIRRYLTTHTTSS